MKFVFDAVVLSTQENKSKDGKNTYYRVNLDQDGEIVTLDCTADVVKLIGSQKYKPFLFTGRYAKFEYQGRVYTRLEVIDCRLNQK